MLPIVFLLRMKVSCCGCGLCNFSKLNLTLYFLVGHNFGCAHDRGTDDQCDDVGYSFGWRDPEAKFRTIMAKNCRSDQCDNNPGGGCARIGRFSNPDQLYNGKPLGSDGNNCVGRINEKRFEVCEYYTCGPIPTPPTPSPTVSLAPTMTQILGGDCILHGGNMGSWAQFTIQTDEWGEDTSWELFDEDGELIAYHDIRSYFDDYHHERFVCVPPGLLTFTIKDSYGDGKFLGFVQTKLFIFQGVSKGSHFSTRANCGWVLPTLCRYPVQLHQRQRFW